MSISSSLVSIAEIPSKTGSGTPMAFTHTGVLSPPCTGSCSPKMRTGDSSNTTLLVRTVPVARSRSTIVQTRSSRDRRWFLLFQERADENADVLLFALNVFEYGPESPLPNRGHVHLSLLDAVKHSTPAR